MAATAAAESLDCGAKHKVTATIHRKLNRSNAVEPVIGHTKSDSRLSRNFLKGIEGDAMNALLLGTGHNMRKFLKKLRFLCAKLDITLYEILGNHRVQIFQSQAVTV